MSASSSDGILVKVEVAERQVQGPYDFERYVREVRANMPDDFVLRARDDGKSPDERWVGFAQACADDVETFVSTYLAKPLDTADVSFWLNMVRGISDANKLVALFALGIVGDDALSLVCDVARLCRIAGVAADHDAGERRVEDICDDAVTDDVIYVFLCGAGALWLDWALNMGQICGAIANVNFETALRRASAEDTNELVSRFGAQPKLARRMMSICMSGFNTLQQSTWEESDNVAHDGSLVLSEEVMRPEVLNIVLPIITSRTYGERSSLHGWCKLARLSPTRCLFG